MQRSYFQNRDRWITRASEWALFALARSVRWLTYVVPVWTLSGFVGAVCGRLVMLVPGPRLRALENLALVWPDRSPGEHRRIVRAAANQFARLSVEYAHLDRFVRGLEINAQGVEHLAAARKGGRGAVLVTAHYGNWEAARLAALRAGCETGIIFRRFNNRYLTRFTEALIPCCGGPVLTKGHRGMRRLVQHVLRGGFMMILVDQRNSGAPFLDFMGHPAETVVAAADLAHRNGAALIPVVARRNVARRRFDVTFEAPVANDNPAMMMQEVNNRIAAWIEADPDQWLWFHRRWKRTTRSREAGDGLNDGG